MRASALRQRGRPGRSRTIGGPVVARIGRHVHLAARRAEVDAARLERVDRHRFAQDVDVTVALRQPVGERLPLVPAGAAAVHAQLAVGGIVFRVALDRHDVDGVRLVGVDVDGKAEVGRQIAADLAPGLAAVVAAHDVPVLLHEQHRGARRVHRDAVDAVADLGVRIGDVLGLQPAVDRPPGLAAVVGAKRAGGRDRDEDAFRVRRDRGGSCAAPCRRRRASTAVPSRGRGARAVPATSGRRRSCGTARRPRRPRRPCRDRCSDGSRCQTRLNSQGCGVPSYHWCVPGSPS